MKVNRISSTKLARFVRQIIGFAIVGAARTLASLVLYWGLNIVLPYWISFTICFVLTVAASALINSQVVFLTQLTVTNMMAYAVAYVTSYCLSLSILILTVDFIRVAPALAPLIVVPIMFPINFLLERWALHLNLRRRAL